MATSPPESRWSREAVEEFLKREKPRYQKVLLPYGLSTEGEDRSNVADLVFPKDLSGKTVLDVGCFLGFFCLEAARRGASRIVGVDIDRDRLRQARTLSEIVGATIEYAHLDIEQSNPPGVFDYVLFLNVLHHVRDPIAVLDRLIAHTRERLILEIAGPDNPRPARMLKKLGAGWIARRSLGNLPVIVVGRNGTPGHGPEQKFFFSAPALQHFLLCQRRSFAGLDVRPSPFKDRFLMIARKRRIERLVLIAGPSGSGKSTLLARLLSRQCGDIASACGLGDPEEWVGSDRKRLLKDERQFLPKLIYHYDTLNPWGRDARIYSRDENLDVLGCSREVSALHCLATRRTLIQRLERELSERETAENARKSKQRQGTATDSTRAGSARTLRRQGTSERASSRVAGLLPRSQRPFIFRGYHRRTAPSR